jgi:hypothetical protein
LRRIGGFSICDLLQGTENTPITRRKRVGVAVPAPELAQFFTGTTIGVHKFPGNFADLSKKRWLAPFTYLLNL